MLEDMAVRRFGEKTRRDYIRHVEAFASFLGRSPDAATADDVRRYQVHLTESGVQPPTLNSSASALRFFFATTLDRAELARHLARVHDPPQLPRGLSGKAHRRNASALRTTRTNAKTTWMNPIRRSIDSKRDMVGSAICAASPADATWPSGKDFPGEQAHCPMMLLRNATCSANALRPAPVALTTVRGLRSTNTF